MFVVQFYAKIKIKFNQGCQKNSYTCISREERCQVLYLAPDLLLLVYNNINTRTCSVSFILYRLWGSFNVVIFNLIIFMMVAAHLRAVMSDPGIVPLPTSSLDFSDAQNGKQTLVFFCIETLLNTLFQHFFIILFLKDTSVCKNVCSFQTESV